jgi:hypothetical protein
LVYNDYYNKIVPSLLPAKTTILMTDTDSLMTCIDMPEGENWSKMDILRKLEPILDFSNYPTEHPLYNGSRRNEPGYWKDEGPGYDEVIGFAGSQAKAYSVRFRSASCGLNTPTTRDVVKCKGVRRGASIKFEDHERCVLSMSQHRVAQHSILSKDHIIRTVSFEKRAFSCFDDKRYIMPCGIHTLAYGSVLIPNNEASQECFMCAVDV